MNTDFTGFSFDGIHSSSLNIVRVATNDRYQEDLFPEINDRTSEVPWMDGQYYFGSAWGPREIEISIAFDSMTELQFRKMRRLFGTKKNCELIFDERPYKVYIAKVKDPIGLEYICFDEKIKTLGEERDGIRRGGIGRAYINESTIGYPKERVIPYEYSDETQRIYKGEGKIEFICYFPFARQQFKTIEQYVNSENGNLFTHYDNIYEWEKSSGILRQEVYNDNNIDKCIATSNITTNYNLMIPVYNPGDLDVGFYLFLPFVGGIISPNEGNYVKVYADENGLLIRPITPKSSFDRGVLIDSVHGLIQGVMYDPVVATAQKGRLPWVLTGTLYNEYIAAGDFPHIKRTDWYLDDIDYKQAVYLNCVNGSGDYQIAIHYDYLYF